MSSATPAPTTRSSSSPTPLNPTVPGVEVEIALGSLGPVIANLVGMDVAPTGISFGMKGAYSAGSESATDAGPSVNPE